MLWIFFFILNIELQSFVRDGFNALNNGIFRVRTFLENPQYYIHSDNSQTTVSSNNDNSFNEQINKNKDDSNSEPNSFNSNNEPNSFNSNNYFHNEENNIDQKEQEGTENYKQQENNNNEDIKTNQNTDQNEDQIINEHTDKISDQIEDNPNQSQENSTQTEENSTEIQDNLNQTNSNQENDNETIEFLTNDDSDNGEQYASEETEISNSEKKKYVIHKYPHIDSIVYNIKSPLEQNPSIPKDLLRLFLKSSKMTQAGKNGDYWEIKGQNANFTIRFDPNLVRGIEIEKTNRSCEIKTFQILDMTRDYRLLNTSTLKYPYQQFLFPVFVQTDSLKIRVLENYGDPEMICLKNYTLLAA